MTTSTKPRKGRLAASVLLVALGLTFNPWVLAALLTFDGRIDRPLVLAAIWTMDALLVGAGLRLLLRRASLRTPSAPGSSKANAVLLLGGLLVAIGGAEAAVRLLGYTPWRADGVPPRVQPGGSFYRLDPTLGYTHRAGRFAVTLADGYTFHATHRPNTLRITSPTDTARASDTRPAVWIFGGSITHGWSLDDAYAYPWLVQEHLPKYHVVNFGVGGYGTLHGLIQFRQALADGGRPALVVVAYASMHDARNTFPRERRKEVVPTNRLDGLRHPTARLVPPDRFTYELVEATYHEVPLMRTSALVHLAEKAYNRIEEQALRSHDVSWAILRDFQELVAKHGATLVVAGLLPDPLTQEMLARCRTAGIPAVDISVDLNAPGNRNLPHDTHPSARAHRHYADHLTRYLQTLLH